ncbi:MAG: hypothetical protein H7Z42_04125 [Roseiflexaceae bacterium]|nr:hypothetical protein [Roseiflexaceae bacterium]
MSFLDRLFGRKRAENVSQPTQQERSFPHDEQPLQDNPASQQRTDAQALERYRYMLKTAPPDQIEQAHAEAFATLTPEQRALALQQLSQALPDSERRAYTTDDPRTLARMATRADLRQPGTVERAFGGAGGMGMGGMMAGSLMSSLAGAFIGTTIANQFFNESADFGTGQDVSTEQDATQAQETGLEDGGGDFGGGDFGGGDFGGGDF